MRLLFDAIYNCMNRGFLFCVLAFLMGISSVVNAQELSVSDVRCKLLHNPTYNEYNEIGLYKEGSNLRIYFSCQFNPFMTGFDIKPTLSMGNNGAIDSLSVRVNPIVPDSFKNMNVLPQWRHVIFTINNLETQHIYLSCLWFEGVVELKEKEYVTLEDRGVAVTVDGVDYCIYEARRFATLTNGKSANGELIIPSEVSHEGKEYPVKTIKSSAFQGCSTITSVTIPNSVTTIGSEAFKNCSNLSTINNGENVEVVSYNAFSGTPWYNNQPDGPIYFGKALCACKGELPEGTNLTIKEGTMSITPYVFSFCKGLTSITIPEGITNIDLSTFFVCYDLVSVKLPESLTIINSEAFCECDDIVSIHIPSHVKYICSGAFRDCRSLTSINIPEGVEEIGNEAFFYCNKMTAIAFPESLKKIGRDAFRNCKSLSDIRIPDNVEEISYGAFLGCVKLNSITLSENLKSIGEGAFQYCSDLSTIVCNAQIPPIEIANPDKSYYYPSGVFYQVDKQNCKLYVPKGCEEVYRAAELWKDFNIVEMETGINEVTDEGVKSERSANVIYNLSGQRMTKAQKGINIVGGKKVLY